MKSYNYLKNEPALILCSVRAFSVVFLFYFLNKYSPGGHAIPACLLEIQQLYLVHCVVQVLRAVFGLSHVSCSVSYDRKKGG